MASRYEALLPIGAGGVATVSVGRARGSARLVALKRAHPHVKDDAVLAASLKREAELASRLHHPNVVSVLDVEEVNGELVLVLDYVEGCTMRALTSAVAKAGAALPGAVVRIVLDVAHGLHAAHEAGLVHRDVSPSNVLVGVDGIARIADFGIAKAQFDATDRTETGVLKGKTSYMAPEYVLHQHVTPASDLFSLAVLAWEALTDTRLFKGANEVETLIAVAETVVRPIASERQELAALDPVLCRALARAPEARQPSLGAFAAELEAVAGAHGLLATHDDIGALVRQVFATELAERRRKLAPDDETLLVPTRRSSARVDVRIDHTVLVRPSVPVVPVPTPVPPPVRSSLPPPPSRRPAPRTSHRKDLLTLASALALLAVAVGLLVHRIVKAREDPAVVRAPPTASVVAPPAPAPVVDAAPTPSASVQRRFRRHVPSR